jgi:hypothetical protein
MSETMSRANGLIATKTRAHPSASPITRADATLNCREALATLAVMRHRLGVIGYPTDIVRWASTERPRYNPAGWELADEAYQTDSRRRIEDAADHYIAAAR